MIKHVKLKAHFLPITSTAIPQKRAPIARPALAKDQIWPVLSSGTFISWYIAVAIRPTPCAPCQIKEVAEAAEEPDA